MGLLEVTGLCSSYGSRRVLDGLTLSLCTQESACLIGRNGAGKSTLLRTVAGLKSPESGRILFDGLPIDGMSASHRSRLGIASALQGHRVFRSMTVRENLELARGSRGQIRSAIDVFSVFPVLSAREGDRAEVLSGGLKQLLALACCLVAGPKLILLDEPTLGLSEAAARSVFEHLHRIRDVGSVTLLIVEHRLRTAISLSDRVIGLREGKIAFDLRSEVALADWRQVEEFYGVTNRP
jgi:branched-chain amino acid transport system ATP-binding protein